MALRGAVEANILRSPLVIGTPGEAGAPLPRFVNMCELPGYWMPGTAQTADKRGRGKVVFCCFSVAWWWCMRDLVIGPDNGMLMP